jgi:hypothetical protein
LPSKPHSFPRSVNGGGRGVGGGATGGPVAHFPGCEIRQVKSEPYPGGGSARVDKLIIRTRSRYERKPVAYTSCM